MATGLRFTPLVRIELAQRDVPGARRPSESWVEKWKLGVRPMSDLERDVRSTVLHCCSLTQPPINRSRCSLPIAHGQDHRCGTADDVAAGEYAGQTGHAHLVGDDVSMLVELEFGAGGGK